MQNKIHMEAKRFIDETLNDFHQERIKHLKQFRIREHLEKTCPVLYQTRYGECVPEIVGKMMEEYIFSFDEFLFDGLLRELAIFINTKACNGRKSGITGIDLEFDRDDRRYIVSIKSGPNWGNSSQVAKMKADFILAMKTLRNSNSGLNVVAVNGCCYGRNRVQDKGDYHKYCGQMFWEFISGDPDLYTAIIEPLGHQAKERNEHFATLYCRMKNKFYAEFYNEYCKDSGEVDWARLVRFNSAAVTV